MCTDFGITNPPCSLSCIVHLLLVCFLVHLLLDVVLEAQIFIQEGGGGGGGGGEASEL